MLWELKQDPFQIALSRSPSVKERIKRWPRTYGTMPPSFMVDKYKIELKDVKYEEIESKGYKVFGYVTYGSLLVDINKELHDYVVNAWRKNEPKYSEGYIWFPPRLALVERSVVENDVGLKLLKWKTYRDEIDRLKFNGCLDYAYGWVENVKKNFSKGDHVKKYVAAHAEAHPTRGYTWNQLLKFGLMDRLYNFTETVVNEWYTNFFEQGDWCLSSESFNIGMRARSPDNIIFNYGLDFKLERGRQIGYNPGPSSVNCFVPHHASMNYMRRIFDEYEKILGCKIMSPKTEGGLIYTYIRNAFLQGKKISHFDVSGMELITPSIINGSVRGFPKGLGFTIGRRGDMPELLSGVGPTSDWDMIAHLELLSRILIRAPECIIILGDDATFVGEFSIVSTVLYEAQKSDDDLVRTLGLTCSELMHPVGRNITVDTADKRINLESAEKLIKNPMEIEERWEVAEYFTGYYRNVPVSDVIGKVKPEIGMYSPREMIESYLDIAATT